MKIKIIDSILCKADKELISHITPCLEFQKSFWKQSQFRKVQKIYKANFVNKRTGIFLSGFFPRVKKFLNDKNVPFKIEGEFERIVFEKLPNLPEITLREDQKNLIQKAYEKRRGVVLSPTGSGKTIVALGFMSMFPKSRILFLCHSLDIIDQTYKELKKFNFDNIAILGGGRKDWNNARIVTSTIQTFARLDPKTYCDYFDIVICDEAHHIIDRKSQYGRVLQNLLSPIKIGFTATLPTEKEKLLSLEGLLGPVIGEVTIQQGVELGIMAKPQIILTSVPYKTSISNHYKYKELYEYGIVENRIRNKLIARIIRNIIGKNESVLVMVKEIRHGKIIQDIAKDLFNIDIEFIQGATEAEDRLSVKTLLEAKKKKAVICTSVWREGINIKSLNNIVNACGGKSEIMTLQSLGRGLRKTKTKDKVKIYDFVDPYRYLAEHFVQRLQIYLKNKWEIVGE